MVFKKRRKENMQKFLATSHWYFISTNEDWDCWKVYLNMTSDCGKISDWPAQLQIFHQWPKWQHTRFVCLFVCTFFQWLIYQHEYELICLQDCKLCSYHNYTGYDIAKGLRSPIFFALRIGLNSSKYLLSISLLFIASPSGWLEEWGYFEMWFIPQRAQEAKEQTQTGCAECYAPFGKSKVIKRSDDNWRSDNVCNWNLLCHIWIQPAKCIWMRTNMPIIGFVVLDIAYWVWEKNFKCYLLLIQICSQWWHHLGQGSFPPPKKKFLFLPPPSK